MRLWLVFLFVWTIMVTGCNVYTEPVQPNQETVTINQDQTPIQEEHYYRLIMDGSNVICVETNEQLNFFQCTEDDYRWINGNR